jgi:esterase/lipase superfamily enzyme
MKVEYFKDYSQHLHREMEYKVYGHTGKPVLVFPTSRGRFFQYEDFGMVDALAPFIDSGKIQLFACDGIDGETLMSDWWNGEDRINRHEAYVRYITDELIPRIKGMSKAANNGFEHKLMATGCSLGAYHSANFFFRFPGLFDTLIALSGVYAIDGLFNGFMNHDIYLNSPIHYLSNLTDEAYLDKFRQGRIIICCGQGSYEDQMLADTRKMGEILSSKNVDAWIDIWGEDVNHDWDWWRGQMPYFLEKLSL